MHKKLEDAAANGIPMNPYVMAFDFLGEDGVKSDFTPPSPFLFFRQPLLAQAS